MIEQVSRAILICGALVLLGPPPAAFSQVATRPGATCDGNCLLGHQPCPRYVPGPAAGTYHDNWTDNGYSGPLPPQPEICQRGSHPVDPGSVPLSELSCTQPPTLSPSSGSASGSSLKQPTPTFLRFFCPTTGKTTTVRPPSPALVTMFQFSLGNFRDDERRISPASGASSETTSDCKDPGLLADAYQRGFREGYGGRLFHPDFAWTPAAQPGCSPGTRIDEPGRITCRAYRGSEPPHPSALSCCSQGVLAGIRKLSERLAENAAPGLPPNSPERVCRQNLAIGIQHGEHSCELQRAPATGCLMPACSHPVNYLGCFHLGFFLGFQQKGCREGSATLNNLAPALSEAHRDPNPPASGGAGHPSTTEGAAGAR